MFSKGTESITTVDASVPTVTHADTDSDNLLGKTDVVTITASFSEADSYTNDFYFWDISNNTPHVI